MADAVWQQAPQSQIESVMRTAAVVATDLNTDCWTDLVFATGATASGQLVSYENAAGSGFSQRLLDLGAATNPVAGLGAADLDGDYRPDLVIGNLLAGNMQTYRANASGSFTLLQSVAYGFGGGLGWALAIAAMAGMREKMAKRAKVIPFLDGPGIALIITGLMAMAFVGFNGVLRIN